MISKSLLGPLHCVLCTCVFIFTCQDWYHFSHYWSSPGVSKTLINSELTSALGFTEMSVRKHLWNLFWKEALHLTIPISCSNVDGQHSQHVVKWISEQKICSVLTLLWVCIDPWSYVFSICTLSTGSSQHSNQDEISQVRLLGIQVSDTSVETKM